MRCKNWESSLTVKVHIAFAVLSVKRHLLKSLLSKTDGESVGKKKGLLSPRFWVLWLRWGTAAQLKGVSNRNSVTSVTESLNATLLAWLLNNEIRDTSMSPRKQDRGGVQSRSKAGSKETEKLSYLGYALEALVSETNFSIDNLILGGRPAEFLDQKSKKSLVKKTSLLNKNCIKKLIFPYQTAFIRQSRINKGIQNLEWIRETLDIMPI